jgi:hypothetical protein
LLARFAAVFTWYRPGFSPGEAHVVFVISDVARIFGARGESITIAAPNRNYELNKTGNVRITLHLGAFVQPLLHWKINTFHIF